MKIAFVSSEAAPYAKTGGLADVAGSLPKALEHYGCEVKLFLPRYGSIDEGKNGLWYRSDIGVMPIRIGKKVHQVYLHQAKLPGSNVEVNFIDYPPFYNRKQIYTNDADEDQRFILLCKGVFEVLQRLQWKPDIIHCNDWQTGLIPLYVKDNYNWDDLFKQTATVFTIHNIGYQGRFTPAVRFNAEVRKELYDNNGPTNFDNSFSFMKTGIVTADILNTVSYTYSREILTPQYGAGMENILKQREADLYGILNGIDFNEWNPGTDKYLPNHFSFDNLEGKAKNKKFLLDNFNIPYNPAVPLIGIVARFAGQKGFDLLSGIANEIMQMDAQWIILGSGEASYEDLFRSLSMKYPHKSACYIGFNNELSHLIEAGADMFLMPSRYEPCGLNQLYSLRYGTVPIVRKTGGLADTVQDWHELKQYGFETGTGFSFNDYSSYALLTTLHRAIETFFDKETWRKIQMNGMKKDYSWDQSAKEYIRLYEKAINKRNH